MSEPGVHPTAEPPLPAELQPLIELLASEVHAEWMRTKRAQGWKLGPLDHHERTHPDLVLYDELPNESKDLDRASATVTIRTILRLGFSIAARNEATARASREAAS